MKPHLPTVGLLFSRGQAGHLPGKATEQVVNRQSAELTPARRVPYLFSMTVETLEEALSHGWRIRVRCAWGKHDGMKSIRECIDSAELDLQTLVWTRGRDFPLSRLESRMKCPRCGSRDVRLLYDVPTRPREARA